MGLLRSLLLHLLHFGESQYHCSLALIHTMCSKNQELNLQLVGGDEGCRLLQKSCHCCTGVLHTNFVLTLHDALMIWATSGDSPAIGSAQQNYWKYPTKLLFTRLIQSQIGCYKFVPGSWSRCWWAGINSGVVPGSINRTNCENQGTMAVFANRELSPRLSSNHVQVHPALFQLY